MKKSKNIILSVFIVLILLMWLFVMYFTSNNVSAEMHTDLNMVAIDTDYNIHTLNSLPNGTKDIYDSNNNVLVKNTNTIILNGSELGWWSGPIVSPNRKQRFILTVADCAFTSSENDYIMISDKFKITNDFWGSSEEHVIAGHTSSRLIQLSSIITADMTLAEFKTWLSQNPVTVVYQLKEPQEILLLSGGYLPITDVANFITKKNQGYLSYDNTSVTADLEYKQVVTGTIKNLYNVDIKNKVLYNYYNMDFKNCGDYYDIDGDFGNLITVKLYLEFVKPFFFRDDIIISSTDLDVEYVEATDINDVVYYGQINHNTDKIIFTDMAIKNYPIKKIYVHIPEVRRHFSDVKIYQDNYIYKFGYSDGYKVGLDNGFSEGNNQGYNNGYTAGVNDSAGEYQAGYNQGMKTANDNHNAVMDFFPSIFGSLSFFFVNTLGGMSLFGISVLDIILTFSAITVFLIFIKILRG